MWFWKQSLSTKFVLTAIALSLVSMTIIGIIGFSLGQRGIQTHTDLHLQSVAALKTDAVLNWLESHRSILSRNLYPSGSTTSVDSVLLTEPGSPAHDEAVRDIQTNFQHPYDPTSSIQNLLLLNSEGRIQYSKDPQMPIAPGALEIIRDNGSAGLYASLIWAPGNVNGASSLVMAEPAQGDIPGVSVAYLDPAPIQTLLKPDAALGDRGVVYLIQPGNGAFTFEGSFRGPLLATLSGLEKPTNGTILMFDDPQGVELVGQVEKVGDLPWRIVAAIPSKDAFFDVQDMKLFMSIAILVIGSLSALGAWRLGVAIVSPLKELAEGATQIGQGNLDYRVTVHSTDEVGNVANRFNKMAMSLASTRWTLLEAERERLHPTSKANEFSEPYRFPWW